MAATKDRAKDAKAKEAAAKAKEKEKAARAKEKEKAARAKEKEKAARAKEKEKAAKAKDKEREAKRKEKEKAAKAKEKEKAAKAKEKERAAKAEERAERPARDRQARDTAAATASSADEVVQPVEEVAVEERGESEPVPDAEPADEPAASPAAELEVPDNDKTVRPAGYIAEALGKEDAVSRSTQRATLAASYTTRDHDVIRAWAETPGGRPADVKDTGDDGAGIGVLRIEFPDGPGDDSRLEQIDWSAFFTTFDGSDVDFLYQERVRTGGVSRFHKFVRADA